MTRLAKFGLPCGRNLGRHYRVLEFLGEGWEGEVYKVEELATGIIRAAKLFYRHRYTSKSPHITYAKKLFELKNCPIVIQYHHQDTIQIRRQPIDFLVSEFVDGIVLSQYIKKQPQQRLLPFEALHLFYAIVQGVEQIHFLGEYHGDIHVDNILVKRKGIQFQVFLIDLLNLGKTNKHRIQEDVFDLINVLYEMIGGIKYYRRMPKHIKQIILGRKHNLIAKQFKMAGHLRLFLENLECD